MAIQQLTQPIINPISAFDSTRAHTISFVVIGGAQVIGNRLVISDNKTGKEIYNKIQSTMKLEHSIPANTLTNGGYYNAVVYTIDSANNESVASTPVPFYCYSQPSLTIDNIPATETIENGTYKFVGSYLQQENELLNSYQYTLYNSNKNILSQSALIYYDTDSSLSYTFVGMSNDTAYYIELSGETINGTKITSGLKYFTVRYIQPASFAICDLVNNCEDGYIQISSNIVAIDGKSNPDPPIYIDDKEVDLRDPNSWVEWNSGFRIQDDFTMRVWGRDFNDYQNIITLTNDINTTSTPNRIELKWMVGDVIKTLPNYTTVEGKSINILDAEAAKIENLSIGGSLEQKTEDEIDFGTDKYLTINTEKVLPLQVNVLGNSEQETSTQGKNYFTGNKIDGGTNLGITYSFDNSTFKINGSSTSGGNVMQGMTKVILKAGTYNFNARTKSGTFTRETNKDFAIYFKKSDGSYLTGSYQTSGITGSNIQQGGGSTAINITLSEDVELRTDLFINGTGITFSNLELNIQIESGNTPTEFEQFIPNMPSPDYPSEIKTVGNNVNLFDLETYYNLSPVTNCTKELLNNGIRIKFNAGADAWIGNVYNKGSAISVQERPACIKVSPNTTYTIRAESSFVKCFLSFFDENYTAVKAFYYISPWTHQYTFTTDSSTYYIYLRLGYQSSTSGQTSYDFTDIKFEKGMVSTSYSPYNQGSVKVTKCNKNLAKIDETNWTLTDDRIKNNGKNAGFVLTRFKVRKGQKVNYSLKLFSQPAVDTSFMIYIDNAGDLNLSFLGIQKFKLNITYTKTYIATKDCEISSKMWGNANADIFEFQFWAEIDETTDYEQHQEQSYILPVQQEMLEGDLFTQGLNKKEIHHWNKLFLTGEETWYTNINSGWTQNKHIFALPFSGVETNGQSTNVGIVLKSNNFKCTNTGELVWKPQNYISYYPAYRGGSIMINHQGVTTLTDFKAWLKSQYDVGTPVIVYYKLETPTSIDCTTQQSNVSDELNQLESYYPQTNIYTEENIALINAKYLGLPNPYNPSKIYSLGDIKNLIDIPAFNIKYDQQYFQSTNTNFILKPNFIYTLSFDYNVNETSTDIYYSIGYGTNGYDVDLKSNIQYQSLTKGRNSVSFIVPENIPNNVSLWVRFAQTIILADINVDISNIQLESGNISTDYEDPNLYNIYPTSASKNLFNYDSPVYLLKNNATYTPIQNGYNIKPTVINQDAYIGIGIKNVLNSGDIYTISFSQLGQFEKFSLYTTEKGSENIISEIPINNNSFVAPEGVYDLQLVFGVDSSSLSNYIEIWNIQIEANNVISEYEPYISNSSVISLDEPLRGLGEYRDLICLESPNILNPETQSGIVKGDTIYYLNQASNTQYYIWYYNEDGNLIKFIDAEGHEASGIVGIKGSFTTHKDCVKITITKSSNPDSQDVTSDELKTNHVGITKGNAAQVYYPYVTEPSVVRYIQHRVFDGVNNKFITKHNSIYTDTNGFYQFSLPGKILGHAGDVQYGICNYLKYIKNVSAVQAVKSTGLWWEGTSLYNYASLPITNLNDANQWLVNLNNAKNPMAIDYVLKTPVVTSLSEDNISALKALSTYKPISNVFTNNEILGYLKLDYVSDYTEQQTQNAYVLLKCWNANSMPYICHSNYIDIPNEKDKVFIWMRRKNNLFDLKIENLGDYNEDDKPTDKTKPIVTLEINPNTVEDTKIPVTAYSIDDNGLKTVRFSKDNGNTWDEIVNVDGLSSTNSYIFINLNPNTTYTIRVEAIDLAGNIGGISQQVTTKSS